jgi:cytidylate kinase
MTQVICISRGTQSGGRELADQLAAKLDYACLGREELNEAATQQGIQVGKLEMAMVRPGIFSERLALERDHYLAFTTAYLCDKAMEGGLVYHGRTGHFLLPGVSHVLKVRVLADQEYRIKAVMRDLGLERGKARRYIDDVDEDRRRWVRSMYAVSWEDAANYDVVLNLAQVSMENAATVLMNMAQLPDFQMTPASRRSMEDLRLAAKARTVLAQDERSHAASVKVRADNGVVNVTYLPQDARLAQIIPEVCEDLPGARDIRVTMAMTNLLWIQEEFQPQSELYDEVVDLATKWNAAVELIRPAPEEESPAPREEALEQTGSEPASVATTEYDGGIEEDVADEEAANGGLKQTLDELARIGRSGGGRVVYGDPNQLVDTLDRSVPYTLVVLGDLFLSKGHAARLRATRDLRSFLSDRIKAPVVTADELGGQYFFGKRDIIRTAVFLLLAVAAYFLVFTHQEPILGFLAHSGWYAEAIEGTFLSRFEWMSKLIVSLVVFLFVPFVAYSYGTVSRAVLKLIKME